MWNHFLTDIEVMDAKNDSIFVSVFASPLGASQFKAVGTAQVRMDIFTTGAAQSGDPKTEDSSPVKRDGWIDLP